MTKTKKKQKKLVEKISGKFDEKSQIKNVEIEIGKTKVTIFYVESIVDKRLFSSGVLSPLQKFSKEDEKNYSEAELVETLTDEVFSVFSIEETDDEDTIIKNILSGFACVVIGQKCLCVPLFEAQKRGIEEPPTSRVVKGPREGFVEDLLVNIGLIRKRIKTTDLKIEDMFIGKQTSTHISVVYIEGIAREDIIKEVKEKLSKINIDAVIDSYYIETFLETNKIKFFRRVGNTEKPDIFCAKILEGRIGIVVDGSPIVLTVPFVMFEDLQSSQDYYTIPSMASFARIMRLFGLIFAVLAPGVYVALQSYNYRILPINFLIAILSSIEGLSLPPLVEVMLVLFLFEVITEASLQMPNSLGMALSIIGALALGNTAVDAGIISPPSIVVVAISSVTLYIIPEEISVTRLLRLLFTTIGGIIGLYGIITTFMILVAYMCSIKSFGVPYFTPYAPSQHKDKQDGFIKQTLQGMKFRPRFLAGKNKKRLSDDALDEED